MLTVLYSYCTQVETGQEENQVELIMSQDPYVVGEGGDSVDNEDTGCRSTLVNLH